MIIVPVFGNVFSAEVGIPQWLTSPLQLFSLRFNRWIIDFTNIYSPNCLVSTVLSDCGVITIPLMIRISFYFSVIGCYVCNPLQLLYVSHMTE